MLAVAVAVFIKSVWWLDFVRLFHFVLKWLCRPLRGASLAKNLWCPKQLTKVWCAVGTSCKDKCRKCLAVIHIPRYNFRRCWPESAFCHFIWFLYYSHWNRATHAMMLVSRMASALGWPLCVKIHEKGTCVCVWFSNTKFCMLLTTVVQKSSVQLGTKVHQK